jgi:uncharacterized membrane protein YfcA
MQDERRLPMPILAIIGFGAGILSGLFGVGGGVVLVPGLVFAGLGQHRAQATSLAAIVPIAIVGALVFGGAQAVDLAAAAVLIVGSVIGVRAGAAVMHRLSSRRLTWIFAGFLVIVAITMLLR